VLEHAPLAAAYWDGHFNVRWLNRACAALFRKPINEVVGRSFFDLFPESREQLHAFYQRILDNGVPVEVSEQPYRLPDGGLTYWAASHIPVRDPAGTVAGVLTMAHEVTTGVVARQQAEAERRRLLAILDTLPMAVMVTDAAGRYQIFNQAAARNWSRMGATPFAVETPPAALRQLDGQPMPLEEMAGVRALRSGQPVHNVAMRMFFPDGGSEPLIVSATPLRGRDGEMEGCVLVGHNPTPEWERQRLAERTRALETIADLRSRLLACVSHELRTPLGHIVGYARTLRQQADTLDPAEQAECLDVILEAAAQLERRIDDLLDASQVEAGRSPLIMGVVDIPAVAARVVERVRRAAPGQVVGLAFPATFPPVPGDAGRLEQVLENLIGNASRHAPGAPIMVGGCVRRTEVEVWVRDSGPGFAAEHLPRLFEPLAGPRVNGRGGLGLGLSICQGIVAAHRGRIWAVNRRRGATVYFAIPRRRLSSASDGAPPGDRAFSADEAAPWRSSPR
jgi:PAS domain S-box-containing protein